jgi:excisionase family DNA binding protein
MKTMETKKIAQKKTTAAPVFPVLLRKKEVSAILCCSCTELDRIIERGEIRYDYKRGSTILFKEETIHAYLESIKVKID